MAEEENKPDSAADAAAAKSDELARELASARKANKELEGKLAAFEKAKLTGEERMAADLKERDAQLAEALGQLNGMIKRERHRTLMDAVTTAAPGVPAARLGALVRSLDGDLDIAPEQVSDAHVKKIVAKLKELDPDSFKSEGNENPRPPGSGGRFESSDKIDYRARGRLLAGRK